MASPVLEHGSLNTTGHCGSQSEADETDITSSGVMVHMQSTDKYFSSELSESLEKNHLLGSLIQILALTDSQLTARFSHTWNDFLNHYSLKGNNVKI